MNKVLLDQAKFLEAIQKLITEAQLEKGNRKKGSTPWYLWEWRLDALLGVETMICSGYYDET